MSLLRKGLSLNKRFFLRSCFECRRKIIETKGTIDVKSQEGIGTSTLIKLPLEDKSARPS